MNYRRFVEKYGKVPSTVSVNGISLNLSSFTYLMGKAVASINSGTTSAVRKRRVQSFSALTNTSL